MAQKIRRWLDTVYDRLITDSYDDYVLVIGDEGHGKSNLILALLWWYKDVRGVEQSVDSVLDQLVWTKSEFKEALADWDQQEAIGAMDAARILHKRKAMHPEQIDLESDIFDVRVKEHLTLLGFQDWDTVPSSLQNRRARHALYIPQRGVVWGYSRDSIDDRVGASDWPKPDLRDRIPFLGDLEPTQDLWETVEELDLEKKKERLQGDDEEEGRTTEELMRRQATKTVLRAVKPWDDDSGMSYEEAAQLVDYSSSWVGNRCREWRHGDYDDLLGIGAGETHREEGVA